MTKFSPGTFLVIWNLSLPDTANKSSIPVLCFCGSRRMLTWLLRPSVTIVHTKLRNYILFVIFPSNHYLWPTWENLWFSPTNFKSFFLFKKIYLFFNWRIIALQNFVVFCQTSTWICHSIPVPPPSWSSLPSCF